MEWEGQLEKLREELSVRTIAKEISAARAPYTVKVLAYKNSDGRIKPGELIVGSSVAGVSVANDLYIYVLVRSHLWDIMWKK